MADPRLPDHIASSVSELAELYTTHTADMSIAERSIRRMTQVIGRPLFLLALIGLAIVWMVINAFGFMPAGVIDEPPFVYMELAATLTGVTMTVLILVTQQRDDALMERREQLTLQLAVVNDQKNAKIIALLEELRRDLPGISSRPDDEAAEMAEPGNPKNILDAITATHGKPQSGEDERSFDDRAGQ